MYVYIILCAYYIICYLYTYIYVTLYYRFLKSREAAEVVTAVKGKTVDVAVQCGQEWVRGPACSQSKTELNAQKGLRVFSIPYRDS